MSFLKDVSMRFYLTALLCVITSCLYASEPKGTVCILPLSKEAVIDEMSGAPGDKVGQKLPNYSIQIDKSTIVQVDSQTTQWLQVPTKGKHLIKIYANNALAHSFFFTFSNFKSTYLALGMSEVGYQTWSLSESKACEKLRKNAL